MSLVFAIYLSATSTGLNVMTQIFEQKGYKYLGNISIFTIFTFGMIGNFVCVLYIKHLKYNHSFFLHSLGYLLFVISGVFICYCSDDDSGICNQYFIHTITIVFSAISGFTSSGLFITQNDYVGQISKKNKKAGLYYGIAWALLQLSQIIGSIYSTFLIVEIKQFNFYCLMVIIGAVGSLAFLFVSEPKQIPSQSIQVEEEESDELIVKLGPSSVLKAMNEFRAKCLIFPMMFTGCLLSFQWNVMHFLIENSLDISSLSNEEINKYTLMVMIALGICEFLGGIIIGLVNSYVPKHSSQQIQFQIFFVALLIAIINNFEYKYGLCFFVASLWGFVDCATTSTLLAILAQDWNNQIQYFGLFNFLQCLGGMISTMVSIALAKQSIIWSIFYLILILSASKFSVSCYQRLYVLK